MTGKFPLKCVECGRIIWVPIEDADLEMTCSQCLREEMREMNGFDPVRYMDYIEDTRLPEEFEGD